MIELLKTYLFNYFQFIEKLDSGKYKLHSQNHESHEEFDFLIWAGHPFDLPKLMYPCDMKNYLFDLFKTQESTYSTASFLSMKNSIRGKEFYRWHCCCFGNRTQCQIGLLFFPLHYFHSFRICQKIQFYFYK